MKTRIVPTGPSNGYGATGQHLAQYFDPTYELWFDIGNPHDTLADAERAAAGVSTEIMEWVDRDEPVQTPPHFRTSCQVCRRGLETDREDVYRGDEPWTYRCGDHRRAMTPSDTEGR